jgi:hypothetical protein
LFHDQPWVRYTNQHGPTLPKEGLSRPYNGLGDEWIKALDAKRALAAASNTQNGDGDASEQQQQQQQQQQQSESGDGDGGVTTRRKKRRAGDPSMYHVRGPAYLHYKVVEPDPSQ